MKKIILTFALSALILTGQLIALAEEPSAVTAVDGNVTISAAVDAAEGTPVLIFILPAITEEDGSDVTAESVQCITSAEVLDTLNVEYVALEYVSDGRIEHTCTMKNSLTTGVCQVVLSYLGSDGCHLAGTFEHVGANDKNALVSAMNEADKDTCTSVIDEDINGKLDEDGETLLEEPKEILRKSSADVAYYNSLEDKELFHELLYKLKGEADFDLPLLVDCFNKAGVWVRLGTESDTLGVLSSYNGEGIGKYWNIAIDEASDYASLPAAERESLLALIKAGGYSDNTALEDDFREGVMLGLFRSVTTREELEALIASDGSYGEDFADSRDIIADADLNEYNKAIMYNNILAGNSACKSIEEIEALFKSSVPKKQEASSESTGSTDSGKGNGGGGNRVGSSSGGAATYKPSAVLPVSALPFADVAESHWAYTYVKKLYDNGTVNGVSSDSFAPGLSVTRQDFVKLLVGALGIETSVSEISFDDVEEGSYYAPFVATACQNGLVSGMGNGFFGVGLSIRREDAAVIMDRVLSKYAIETGDKDMTFADEADISDYAKASVERVAAAEIFGGDANGSFNPKDSLSRAEACAILVRLTEIIKEV